MRPCFTVSTLARNALAFSVLSMCFAGPVSADIPVTDPLSNGLCPADTVGQNLNCVAKDVSVAVVISEEEGATCVTGGTITLPLDTVVKVNSGSARPDVAAWLPMVADIGKNMLATSANGGPAACISSAFREPLFADGNGTLEVVSDTDDDSCGDLNGVTAEVTEYFADVEIPCMGEIGGAKIEALLSWNTPGNNPTCEVHQDYGGFGKSKCAYSTSFVDLVVVGKLEICKAASLGTDGDFGFEVLGGTVWVEDTALSDPIDVEGFTLNPADGTGGVSCVTFEVMTQQGEDMNTVEIAEVSVPVDSDFSVADISCLNNTPGGGAVEFDRTDKNAFEINLTEGVVDGDAGQSDVTCTFTNTEGGSITIIKDAIPNSTQPFDYTITGPDRFEVNFSLDDDGNGGLPNSATYDSLDEGVYTIFEGAVDGWTVSDVACFDGEDQLDPKVSELGYTLFVADGSNIVCTFTNVQQGVAVIRKLALPETDTTTEFVFEGCDSATSLTNNGTAECAVIAVPVPTATREVNEVVPEGWDLASIVCDDGDSSGNVERAMATFNVDAGEVVTCTFTNVQKGNIVVEKTAVGGDAEFGFEPNWGEGFSLVTTDGFGSASFELSASDEIFEAPYSVTELEMADWELDPASVSCDDGSSVDAIDVDPGETVTCSFTNYKDAYVTIRKEAIGFDGEFTFDYTVPEEEGQVLLVTAGGEAEITSVPLTFSGGGFGDWSIVERPSEVGAWFLAMAECDDGQDPADFTVEPGDDIVCTFTNVLPLAVPASNVWTLLLLTLMILAGGWYFRPALMHRS